MARARISRPARSAMQQGQAKTKAWMLEFEPASALRPDNLMGWAGGGDTNHQVRLRFASQADAVAYCTKHGIAHDIATGHDRVVKPKSYADNFKWDRIA